MRTDVLHELGQIKEAAARYRLVLRIKPDYVNAHINLGVDLKDQGQFAPAAASYRKALKIEPAQPLIELGLATRFPAVFRSTEQIDRYRRKILLNLRRFSARDLCLAPSERFRSGAAPPFNIQFHGRDDLTIKRAHADIFRGCFAEQTRTVRSRRRGLPRVGFVVSKGHESAFV